VAKWPLAQPMTERPARAMASFFAGLLPTSVSNFLFGASEARPISQNHPLTSPLPSSPPQNLTAVTTASAIGSAQQASSADPAVTIASSAAFPRQISQDSLLSHSSLPLISPFHNIPALEFSSDDLSSDEVVEHGPSTSFLPPQHPTSTSTHPPSLPLQCNCEYDESCFICSPLRLDPSQRRALDGSSPSRTSSSSSSESPTPDKSKKARSRKRYVNTLPPPSNHKEPVSLFSFKNFCNMPTPPPPSTADGSPDTAISSLLHSKDTTAIFDGSYNPISTRMGASFISHHHHLQRTHINSVGFDAHEDNTSMLAEACAFRDLLCDAIASNSKSIHIIADSKTLQKLGLGKDSTHGPEYNSANYSSSTADIIRMLKTFDSVHISHVRAHKKQLKENSVVDLLAGISCQDPLFTICETVSTSNHNALLSLITSKPKPRNSDRILSIPYIHDLSSAPLCSACRCPSHSRESCCFANSPECYPLLSIFCKIQPDRPSAFIDQASNPAIIDWDAAPASMGGDYFARFTSICINNLRHPDRYLPALHAIHMFAKTYRLVRGHISRHKPRRPHSEAPTPLNAQDQDNRLARDAQTAAEHARNFNYHDAIKTLNRDEPIGPLHTDAAAQLRRLYPDQVQDPHIPSAPPIIGRQIFHRHAVWNYVKNRSVTSSPGVSGFGFNFIQHFARLTAGHETEDNEDPHWTVLVAFIEDLACGALPWLRPWATCLKGSLFNKTRDPNNIKLRNLGIAEALVRIAAYMVSCVATPLARDLGLIGDFDLGVGVPGGTEKFVKLNQLAAAAGLTIFSADIEKAFNSMRRCDIWAAVQQLNCPLLTSWFCFFFHEPPVVHFSIDPRSSFNINNSIQFTLWEGVAQGDPCSSLLFVITLSYILSGFKSRYPDAALLTVIDDTSLVFPDSLSPFLPTVVQDFVHTLDSHNLVVHAEKTTIFKSCEFDFSTDSLPPYSLSHDRFTACRRIIGSRTAVADDTLAIIKDIQTTVTFYTRLHNALQVCRTPGRGLIFTDILRLSFRSRYQWSMRTLTPPAASRVALAADSALSKLLYLVLPHHPPMVLPSAWHHLKTFHSIKLALPLKKGGLGMRSWDSLRHITHFSSWAEAGPRILLLTSRLSFTLPDAVTRDVGDSVAALCKRLINPSSFWELGNPSKRFKLQHLLTDQLDTYDELFASTLSHDPAVNAHFLGSCLPHMCLPFNASAIPRSDLAGCDEALFPYALAFHTMMPLFPPNLCECGEHVDPLGLHYGSCIKINARNLLHNAMRDCCFGSLLHIVRDCPAHNVAILASDKSSKASTYIHHWYPLKPTAPTIFQRQVPYVARPTLVAPSKSPDILVAFSNDPHRPIFGDFVFSSPRLTDSTTHTQAAQIACNSKNADYSRYHSYPENVFFPLAAERSGYLHPTFINFIDIFLARATRSPLPPSHKLNVLYSIAHAITYMSASFLRVAGFSLTPSSLKSLFPPPPFIPPLRWAPGIIFHEPRHRSFGTSSHSLGHQRRRASKPRTSHPPLSTSHLSGARDVLDSP
jgi:hypothetical protein